MESKFLKIENEKEWRNLLDKTLFKTFFHELEWEKFLESQFKWLRFKHYNWRNRALLSLARGVSHPFCEYGGPLPLTNNLDLTEFRNDLLNQFQGVSISFHPRILDYFGVSINKESQRTAYFLKNIDRMTENEVWSSFRKTLKHSIQKAEQSGVEVKRCTNQKELKELYSLFVKSAKKHKVPVYPFSFYKYFFSSPRAEITLAKYKGKIVAGSVFLFYDKFIHYFQSASDEKYKNLNANYLILWNQIKKYLGKEYETFDFGGTRVGSPLQVFKSGWGTEMKPILEITDLPSSGMRKSKLRIIFGLLPPFLIEKLSPYFLKFKKS